METASNVLIVDDDALMLDLLAGCAVARGYLVTRATSQEEAFRALDERPYAAAVIDLHLGEESGLEVIKRLHAGNRGAEAIVISGDVQFTSALDSYAHNIFAFVPKPIDPDGVMDMLGRALERRRIALDNQRLLWELQLLNVAGEIVSSSLELPTMLERTLAHLVAAFGASWSIVRLRSDGRDEAPVVRFHGLTDDFVHRLRARTTSPWASDRAIASGQVERWGDVRARLPEAVDLLDEINTASVLAVPIPSGGTVIGALTIGASEPNRFTADDARLMSTFATQLGVAIANADLYQRIWRAKAEWEGTFDAIGDCIATYDADGRLVRANRAMLNARRWSWDDLHRRTCSEAGFCGGGDDCSVRAAAAGRAESRAEVAMADGRTFEVTTFPVTEPRADRAAVVQVAVDVTERLATTARIEQMRQQLLQSEKLSALGQLVAGVAHELNNPLTSVIGYAQLINEEVKGRAGAGVSAELAAQVNADISLVLAEADRAANIVRNLLAFARQQTGERRPQDVGDAVASAVALREYSLRQNGIELRFSHPSGLPPVAVDPTQMQQAILNLVLNAERAVRDAEEPYIAISVAADRRLHAVRIEVADNGHGIDPAALGHVFDPFFTTRPVGEGTGLGLSTCYGIVRDHGGTIVAHSAPGQPTRFSILLPALDETAAARAVLVAHGESAARTHFASLFAGWGHRTVSAASAREAATAMQDVTPAIAFLDRALIEAEPAEWRAFIGQLDPAVRLLIGGPADGAFAPGGAAAFARSRGALVVSPPYDLASIRAALGEASP